MRLNATPCLELASTVQREPNIRKYPIGPPHLRRRQLPRASTPASTTSSPPLSSASPPPPQACMDVGAPGVAGSSLGQLPQPVQLAPLPAPGRPPISALRSTMYSSIYVWSYSSSAPWNSSSGLASTYCFVVMDPNCIVLCKTLHDQVQFDYTHIFPCEYGLTVTTRTTNFRFGSLHASLQLQ